MATQLPTDAEAFARFLTEQIANGGAEQSPEELLRIWRREHAEAIEDVRQGYKNMEAGLTRWAARAWRAAVSIPMITSPRSFPRWPL